MHASYITAFSCSQGDQKLKTCLCVPCLEQMMGFATAEWTENAQALGAAGLSPLQPCFHGGIVLWVPLAPLANHCLYLTGNCWNDSSDVHTNSRLIVFCLEINFFSIPLAYGSHTWWRSVFVESWQCSYFYSVALIHHFSFPRIKHCCSFSLSTMKSWREECLLPIFTLRFQRWKAQDG